MLLEHILADLDDPAHDHLLGRIAADEAQSLVKTARPSKRALVERSEGEVRADPDRAFQFDERNHAVLEAAGHRWSAGKFETVSLAELRRRLAVAGPGKASVRLSVILGSGPLTDIGALQAGAGEGALFQVASQFNCLESPDRDRIVPVHHYFNDFTQGPRASISAFPATLLRHYAAPRSDGSRFEQKTGGDQLDLLEDACRRRVSVNGYFTGHGRDRDMLLESLTARFDQIRVGVHDDVEVVLGYDWDGSVPRDNQRIAQLFTSTVAGGYGGTSALGEAFTPISRQLLRAAYLGTFLAAASLGRNRVVATLIGGGVFNNSISEIWSAIQWAAGEIEPLLSRDMDVIVNGHKTFALSLDPAGEVLPIVRKRHGAIFTFDRTGLTSIHR